MKIVVAIKQVPERDAQVRIDVSGKWIEESNVQFAMNESDAYALEEALQLKEKHGGEVVVLSAGPERIGTRFAKRWPRAPIAPSMSIPTRSPNDRLQWRGCWPRPSSPKSPTWCSPGCSLRTSAWARPA